MKLGLLEPFKSKTVTVSALRLKNRLHKSVEQGGILSPFLFNIFDTLIMREFERRCALEELDVKILGYADDHVICVRYLKDANRALELFALVCREFGMILEMSKTEFVIPTCVLSSTPSLSLPISKKESVEIPPKSSVKWLGFNLNYQRTHRLQLHLGCLAKMHSYVSELAPHVSHDSFQAIFRSYVQSTLNYFYIPAKFLKGESLDRFKYWELKLRSIRDVNSMALTADICQSQLQILEQQYPMNPYALR